MFVYAVCVYICGQEYVNPGRCLYAGRYVYISMCMYMLVYVCIFWFVGMCWQVYIFLLVCVYTGRCVYMLAGMYILARVCI